VSSASSLAGPGLAWLGLPACLPHCVAAAAAAESAATALTLRSALSASAIPAVPGRAGPGRAADALALDWQGRPIHPILNSPDSCPQLPLRTMMHSLKAAMLSEFLRPEGTTTTTDDDDALGCRPLIKPPVRLARRLLQQVFRGLGPMASWNCPVSCLPLAAVLVRVENRCDGAAAMAFFPSC
jgi:hypothetical protein